MPLEVTLAGERSTTDLAVGRLVLPVCKLVPLEVAAVCEVLATDHAHVWLLTRVYLQNTHLYYIPMG